jgi:hypothetical protein
MPTKSKNTPRALFVVVRRRSSFKGENEKSSLNEMLAKLLRKVLLWLYVCLVTAEFNVNYVLLVRKQKKLGNLFSFGKIKIVFHIARF